MLFAHFKIELKVWRLENIADLITGMTLALLENERKF